MEEVVGVVSYDSGTLALGRSLPGWYFGITPSRTQIVWNIIYYYMLECTSFSLNTSKSKLIVCRFTNQRSWSLFFICWINPSYQYQFYHFCWINHGTIGIHHYLHQLPADRRAEANSTRFRSFISISMKRGCAPPCAGTCAWLAWQACGEIPADQTPMVDAKNNNNGSW